MSSQRAMLGMHDYTDYVVRYLTVPTGVWRALSVRVQSALAGRDRGRWSRPSRLRRDGRGDRDGSKRTIIAV